MRTKFSGILTLLLAFVVQISFAQEKTVTGTVTDGDGLPLPGVNIILQGTSSGTQTDFDGNYSIEVSIGDVLEFSYVGFETQEISIGQASTYDVSLQPDASELDEVVVTALGIERKPRELSYSVSSLDNEQLTKTRAVNTATAMVGKVSGLQVNTIGNGVNPNTRVVLRGNRSLLGNNEALIVIDGYQSTRGTLDRINPNDIQDITVLKGGNAAALYGSDAANGVIVITTKQGKGKMNVTFKTSQQFERVSYLPDVQDEFGVGGFPNGTLRPLENVNFGPRFDGRMVPASETLADGSAWMVPYSPEEDHFKNFFTTGSNIRNSVQISSGDEDSSILFSLDHSNVEGTVPNDAYNQTNARLNAMKKFGNLTVKSNFSFFRSHQNVVGTTNSPGQFRPLYFLVLNTPLHIPFADIKNWRDGRYTRNETSFFRFYENPYWSIDNNRNRTDRNEFTFINNFNYKFTDWISASLNVGYTNSNYNYKSTKGGYSYDFHVPDPYGEISAYEPSVTEEMYNFKRVNSDFIVNINKDFANDFNVNANLGQNVRVEDSKTIRVGGNNLILPNFYNISTRTGELTGSETTEEYRKFALYGDVTIGFKDFLFLSGSARNDWTSTLPKENRSFFYPSAGISFIPTTAFPNIKGTLNYLKGSFNYAKVGNDPNPYQTNRRFYSATYDDYLSGNTFAYSFPFGSTAGLALSNQSPDPNLKPEFTTSLEASIEFGFFRGDRLSGSATVYKTNTTDQLTPIATSVASGATSYFTNIGEIENKGLEIDINGDIIKNDNFTWNLGINYTTNESEVIALQDGVDEIEIGGPYVDNSGYGAVVVAKVGESYPLLKTTDYARDDQGRVIVNANGDPTLDSDLKVQGKTTPDYIVGLNTTFSYKNFSLYAVADYRTGHVFYNNLVDALDFTGLTQHSVTSNRQPFIYPNSVYSDGNGGYIENTNRPTSGAGSGFWGTTYNNAKSNYVTDATVLKLREVSLSYTFNKNIVEKIGLTDLGLNIYGRNLLMLRPDENVYTDPEFNYDSGNAVGFGTQNQTPPTRQYGVSLTAKF